LRSPELWLCHPSTLIHSSLACKAFHEACVVQLTIRLALQPDTFLFSGSQICSWAPVNTAVLYTSSEKQTFEEISQLRNVRLDGR